MSIFVSNEVYGNVKKLGKGFRVIFFRSETLSSWFRYRSVS